MMRRVRKGVIGGGASSSSSRSASGNATIIGVGAVVEDYHDHDDDACDTSWAWSDSSADGAAAACATAAATNDGGTSSANHSSTERKGREMSLSEKLRQHELLEQQQQQMQQLHQKQLQHQMQHLQQQHYLQSRRERGGPMSDADHSVSRKLIPPIIQPTTDTTKYLSSSGDSVDSGGWSWPSNTSTTTSHYNTNTNTNATIHGNKRNQLGHQYLYNKYSKRGMFNNTVYQTFRGKGDNQLRTRIMSAMNCTKSPHQHDDDDTDEGDGRTYRDRNHTQQQPLNKMFGMLAKLGLMLLMMTGSVSRLAGRYHSKPKASSLSFKNMPSSSSSISMNDLYLRGQQTSYHAHGEIQQNSTHSTNLSQAILLPAHLSSHLSDIALPYYHSSSSIGTNNFTFRNKTVNNDTPYFWDVHFSGESVAEYIFSACHGLIQACEMGIRQPDFTENKLETFHLDGATYVNVDTTTTEGILRAYQLGLTRSHLADVIVSPHFHYMTSHIFSPDYPGRMFALFRHPVDRAVSMYYYLAKATWDPHYNPDLAKMTLEQYAKSRYIENNWVTRFLVNKLGGKLSRADVLLAKQIIKTKCLVGLYDDMEASMARFQRYFGWNAEETDENKTSIAQCRMDAVRQGDKHVVGHPIRVVKDVDNTSTNMTSSSTLIMPVVRPGSIAWNAIVRMNIFDMELYEFVEKIYEMQGEEIFDVVGYEVPSAEAVRGENVAKELGYERPVLPDDPFEESMATDDNPGKTMPF